MQVTVALSSIVAGTSVSTCVAISNHCLLVLLLIVLVLVILLSPLSTSSNIYCVCSCDIVSVHVILCLFV